MVENIKKFFKEDMSLINKRNALLDYYGISILEFDSGSRVITQKDRDKSEALVYIMEGKELPSSLKQRLLDYKNGIVTNSPVVAYVPKDELTEEDKDELERLLSQRRSK